MNKERNTGTTEERKAQRTNGLNHVLKRSREAFEGKYQQEIKELLGLSDLEVHMMTGLRVDLDLHEELIAVVMEASRLGLPEDELKRRITELGQAAVDIASFVPSLARLFR